VPAACSSSIGAERASCGAACASRYFLGSGLVGRRGGGVRQELAAGVAPMTNHLEEPAPLPALVWAVVFTILLVAAVAVFPLVLSR